jgi:hypothetical protein|nr:MAG TPA: hypothetical protein [Caudoviricetes sp.]
MVLEEIRRRVAVLRSRNALPCHETLLNLKRWAKGKGMTEKALLESIAELRRAGRIEVGRTLNDWWIRPVEDGKAK